MKHAFYQPCRRSQMPEQADWLDSFPSKRWPGPCHPATRSGEPVSSRLGADHERSPDAAQSTRQESQLLRMKRLIELFSSALLSHQFAVFAVHLAPVFSGVHLQSVPIQLVIKLVAVEPTGRQRPFEVKKVFAKIQSSLWPAYACSKVS